MKSPYLIFVGIFFGLAIWFFGSWKCNDSRWQKRYDKIVVYSDALLDSIRNTPEVRDTVTDTVRVHETLYVNVPAPVVIDDADSVGIRQYSGEERGKSYLVRWKVIVAGKLNSIEVLPGSFIKNSEITVKKTIVPPERTPIEITGMSEARFKLYFMAGVGVSRGKMDNINTNLSVLHRKGWGIYGGVGYSDNLYYNFGLIFKIR